MAADPPRPGRPAVVLASRSPRRLELLRRLGLDVTVRPPDVDESVRAAESPEALVQRLADDKAASVSADSAGHLVVAADTVVVSRGRVLGKPRDDVDAGRMLRRLAGDRHEVVTGVAVAHDGTVVIDHARTVVVFRELTDTEVAWYLATGESRDKAGAYAIQGAGAALVERIEGSDTNVIGLPLALTVGLARRVGIDLLGRVVTD